MTGKEISLGLQLGLDAAFEELGQTFAKTGGNITRTAHQLKVEPRTVFRWVAKYDRIRGILESHRMRGPSEPILTPDMPEKMAVDRGVYCIQSGNAVKIGKADSISARIRSLQSASPERLRLLAVLSLDPEDEPRFHAKLEASRIHGEWFRMTPDVRDAIRSALANVEQP